MRLKFLGAAAVAVLAAATLSACRTNVGVAADIGGHQISESRLDSYLLPGGPDKAAVSQLQAIVAKQGGSLGALPEPRAYAAGLLIEQQLLENTLSKLGKTPSTAALAKADEAVTKSGGTSKKELRLLVRAVGLNVGLAPIQVRVTDLVTYLNAIVRAPSAAKFYSYLAAHGGKVSLNPRYGKWDPTTFTVTTSGSAGISGFLKLQPTGDAGT